MASLTIENYAKAILQICGVGGDHPATTGQLAEALSVSPGTVTSMLKTLSEAGLASYTPYEGVRLTEAGNRLALRVLRRHRLIELFLFRTLELPWDEVHEEAEHMEHAASDRLIDRIDAFLGFPACDPHGDPIPRSDGTFVASNAKPLTQLLAGARFRIERVLDQSPDFLRYLSASGLHLGVEAELISNEVGSGVITLAIGASRPTLSHGFAEKVLVAKLD